MRLRIHKAGPGIHVPEDPAHALVCRKFPEAKNRLVEHVQIVIDNAERRLVVLQQHVDDVAVSEAGARKRRQIEKRRVRPQRTHLLFFPDGLPVADEDHRHIRRDQADARDQKVQHARHDDEVQMPAQPACVLLLESPESALIEPGREQERIHGAREFCVQTPHRSDRNKIKQRRRRAVAAPLQACQESTQGVQIGFDGMQHQGLMISAGSTLMLAEHDAV